MFVDLSAMKYQHFYPLFVSIFFVVTDADVSVGLLPFFVGIGDAVVD